MQQLGWTAEKFQKIDRMIESERYRYSRVVDEHGKVDRYGKKYSWIAYFELGGWLRDQGLLSETEDYGRTWDVDIDPSFPSQTPEHRLVSADLLGDTGLSLTEWIKKGPTPNLRPYFRQAAILGESGPWVALDGFVGQQDESRGRGLFAFVRSFLVPKSEAKVFAAFLAKQRLGGRRLPEKPKCHYTFAGEIPWCGTFPKTAATDLRFVVRERKVKARRKRSFFFVDGKPISLTAMDLVRLRLFGLPTSNQVGSTPPTEDEMARVVRRDRMVEVEEVRQEFRKFRTLIPVHDFSSVGRNVDNVPVHGITLAKQLAQSAGLVHLPQTHDLQTKDGARATYGLALHPQDFSNSERFFFVRESILRTLLQKGGFSLIWAVWGERELSYKQMERALPDGDLARSSHADFQSVHRF